MCNDGYPLVSITSPNVNPLVAPISNRYSQRGYESQVLCRPPATPVVLWALDRLCLNIFRLADVAHPVSSGEPAQERPPVVVRQASEVAGTALPEYPLCDGGGYCLLSFGEVDRGGNERISLRIRRMISVQSLQQFLNTHYVVEVGGSGSCFVTTSSNSSHSKCYPCRTRQRSESL